MTKLTILRGVSGSGKSTWARQQNAIVVSRDLIRHGLLDTPDTEWWAWEPEKRNQMENLVTVIQDATIAAMLKQGHDVIVDNTNVQWKFVKQLAKIGYRYGAEVEVKVFDVPYATAVARVNQRALAGGRHVAGEVIQKQYNSLKANKNKTLDVVSNPEPYSGTPGKPEAFMFDLDGTAYHMNNKRGPYEHNVDVDDPDLVVQGLIMVLSEIYTPIAMSGRVEATREKTEFALKRDGVPYRHLFMRADGDMRPDNLVKLDLFDNHVRDNYDVKFVLDDRDQVVEMWRAIGLKCLQVQPGDF